MLTQCHLRSGNRPQALSACAEGRGHYPDDAELLFIEVGLAREGKDYRKAESRTAKSSRGRRQTTSQASMPDCVRSKVGTTWPYSYSRPTDLLRREACGEPP